jgi:RNA polymerase-binding transcription factor DksA
MEIRYRNFKGLGAFDLKLSDTITNIYGANATGKTSLYDGYLWLLFGKDSLNQTDFMIKPVGLETPEVTAEAVFSDDFALKKTMTEKWTKKRGSASPEFTGHEINHFVNGVPTKKKDFDAVITEKFTDLETYRLLTEPRYFNEFLHWQKRRELLFKLSGGEDYPVPDEIKSIIRNQTPQDYLLIIKARKTEINRELTLIPARIDERRKSIILHDNIPLLLPLESRLAVLKSGSGLGVEIAKKQSQIVKFESEFKSEYESKRRELTSAKTQAALNLEIVKSEYTANESAAAQERKRIASLEIEIQSFREKWKEINDSDFAICPTCGQEVPEDRKSAYNMEKSRKLSEISEKGKAMKVLLMKAIENLDGYVTAMKKVTEKIAGINSEYGNIDFFQLDIMQKNYDEEKRRMESEMSELEIGSRDDAVQAEIDQIQEEINAIRLKQVENEASTRSQKRVDELIETQKKLTAELDRIEQQMNLIEGYIRDKCRAVTEAINGKFRQIKFNLFEQQINGGIKEICEAAVNDVPYHSVNGAGRIQAGLDIISAFQHFYGKCFPIWIDNRESVTEIPDMLCPVINLIVSEKDKTLRVEV